MNRHASQYLSSDLDFLWVRMYAAAVEWMVVSGVRVRQVYGGNHFILPVELNVIAPLRLSTSAISLLSPPYICNTFLSSLLRPSYLFSRPMNAMSYVIPCTFFFWSYGKNYANTFLFSVREGSKPLPHTLHKLLFAA